jgi:hypothetical protein
MQMEKNTLQNELAELKKNNQLALEDGTTHSGGELQEVSDKEKKIAEKEEALKLQEYKMDKVKFSMGRDYNPQFNKDKSESTPSLTNSDNIAPLLKDAESMPMLESPSSTKTSPELIKQVDSIMENSLTELAPTHGPTSIPKDDAEEENRQTLN